MHKKGLSKGRNFAIKKARGEILAFTDDDCLVDKDWLKNIYSSFHERKEISATFGRVLPYKPENNLNLSCTAITKFKRKKIISRPRKQERFIFLGNSLSFRRKVFDKIGFFKEWLGVGSVGMATEDEELVYRLFKNKGKVLLNSSVLIYHDGWLTKEDCYRKLTKYQCGFFAAFGYYAFKGDKIAKGYLAFFVKERLLRWQKNLKFCFKDFHPKYLLCFLFKEIPFELYYWLKGLIIAFYFTFIRKD